MKDDDKLNRLIAIIDIGIANSDKTRRIANECLDITEHWHRASVSKTDSDSNQNPAYHIRAETIRPSELLYDKDGLAVAIKSNGKILPIIEGDL